MKIGILETDKVRDTLVEEFGTYPEMFIRLFSSVTSNVTFKVYEVLSGDYPSSVDECDAYLITGSKCSAYEDLPWIHQLSDFIVKLHNAKKNLVGICFGHQLIAIALGGVTQKYKGGWGVGVCDYKLKEKLAWLNTEEINFSLLATHQDQVTRLPSEATLLAGNNFCKNAMFSVGNHILTFQGHPEFIPNYSRCLIHIRREIMGEDVSDDALASLSRRHDGLLIAQWIVAFLKA